MGLPHSTETKLPSTWLHLCHSSKVSVTLHGNSLRPHMEKEHLMVLEVLWRTLLMGLWHVELIYLTWDITNLKQHSGVRTEEEILKSTELIPPSLKSVPGTMSVHQVNSHYMGRCSEFVVFSVFFFSSVQRKGKEAGCIRVRDVSCFCKNWCDRFSPRELKCFLFAWQWRRKGGRRHRWKRNWNWDMGSVELWWRPFSTHCYTGVQVKL